MKPLLTPDVFTAQRNAAMKRQAENAMTENTQQAMYTNAATASMSQATVQENTDILTELETIDKRIRELFTYVDSLRQSLNPVLLPAKNQTPPTQPPSITKSAEITPYRGHLINIKQTIEELKKELNNIHTALDL